ncbi:MAG: magnesium transporter [Alphaproteobacteria bacterium]
MAEAARQDPIQAPETEEAEDLYGLTDEVTRAIVEAIDTKRFDEVARLTAELHAADVADLIERLGGERRELLIKAIGPSLLPETLSHLDYQVREELVDLLPASEIAAALAELDTDDALEIIEDLDTAQQREVLAELPAPDRALVEQGLTYPEESAGRLMQRAFVMVPQFWTVGETIDHLRDSKDDESLPDEFYDLFVVDPKMQLVGAVALSRIMRSRRKVKIAELMKEDIKRIPVDMDQEEVAFLFRQYGLVDAPVIDADGRLLGMITVDDIVHVVGEEAEEDMLKLAGVQESDVFSAVLNTTRSRFTWLFINLLTAIAASVVIGLFEDAIAAVVALAVLMPIVASMGGNAGTQTLTVAVRALATRELSPSNAWRVIFKEVMVGLINGLSFALIMGAIAFFWFSSWQIGAVIGAAMVLNLLAAAFFGAFIPLGLERLGVDPAVASSVFLTTVTDIVGFLAFLGLATVFLL